MIGSYIDSCLHLFTLSCLCVLVGGCTLSNNSLVGVHNISESSLILELESRKIRIPPKEQNLLPTSRQRGHPNLQTSLGTVAGHSNQVPQAPPMAHASVLQPKRRRTCRQTSKPVALPNTLVTPRPEDSDYVKHLRQWLI